MLASKKLKFQHKFNLQHNTMLSQIFSSKMNLSLLPLVLSRRINSLALDDRNSDLALSLSLSLFKVSILFKKYSLNKEAGYKSDRNLPIFVIFSPLTRAVILNSAPSL